jgi:arginyl-tRNA synthetase
MLNSIQLQLNRIVQELYEVDIIVDVSIPDEKFGDAASNVAMQLIGKLSDPPSGGLHEIAEQIAEKIRLLEEVENCNIVEPGFLNIRFKDKFLINSTVESATQLLKGQKIIVEYSDPNPLKPLHAGHLYTTLVGDVIARLVEQSGAETIRLNYGGDVGLHVAKSMWAILKTLDGENPEKLSKIAKDERPIWLGNRYVEGNNAYQDTQIKKEIIALNKKVYDLHVQGDKESKFAQIYWICRQWSYDYFVEFYKKLEVHEFDRFIPESEVTQLGLSTVHEQMTKGVYELSEGAIIFDGEKHGLHKRVFINSEGLPTYEAKDVGLSLMKWQDYKFDKSIIITANEQSQYMQVVIKSIEQFLPKLAASTHHITHGEVRLEGGVKMSSRIGNTITALQILESARFAGQENNKAQAETTVLAAVKYAFLKTRIGGDITYDPADSIAMEGNSGPYLQYAHARACSVLRKANFDLNNQPLLNVSESLEPGERSLVRKLAEYNHIVSKATNELAPHLICHYLYELAQLFNRFYEKNKIIDHERQDTRLRLVALYTKTLSKGLNLLGITAPKQM